MGEHDNAGQKEKLRKLTKRTHSNISNKWICIWMRWKRSLNSRIIFYCERKRTGKKCARARNCVMNSQGEHFSSIRAIFCSIFYWCFNGNDSSSSSINTLISTVLSKFIRIDIWIHGQRNRFEVFVASIGITKLFCIYHSQYFDSFISDSIWYGWMRLNHKFISTTAEELITLPDHRHHFRPAIVCDGQNIGENHRTHRNTTRARAVKMNNWMMCYPKRLNIA